MAARIVVDPAQMDVAAAKIGAVQSGLQGVQGRLSSSFSTGAPPVIGAQVDAAVAEARAAVAGVTNRCSARSTELRRRAIFARIASGDVTTTDLRQLAAWNAEKPLINGRVGNGKVDDGGLDLGAIGNQLGGIGSRTLGFLGRNAAEIGHSSLDVLGVIPLLGEPADGINGLIYTAEGDKLNAGLSYAGMIPLLGWGQRPARSAIRSGRASRRVAAKSRRLSGRNAPTATTTLLPLRWQSSSRRPVSVRVPT